MAVINRGKRRNSELLKEVTFLAIPPHKMTVINNTLTREANEYLWLNRSNQHSMRHSLTNELLYNGTQFVYLNQR